MAVLGQLLTGTHLGALKNAGAIPFDLDGDVWGLDPLSKELIARGLPPSTSMTMRTSPEVLLRLLSDGEFTLRAGEELTVLGDTGPLVAVMEALAGGSSPLSTRISSKGKGTRQ